MDKDISEEVFKSMRFDAEVWAKESPHPTSIFGAVEEASYLAGRRAEYFISQEREKKKALAFYIWLKNNQGELLDSGWAIYSCIVEKLSNDQIYALFEEEYKPKDEL